MYRHEYSGGTTTAMPSDVVTAQVNGMAVSDGLSVEEVETLRKILFKAGFSDHTLHSLFENKRRLK